MILLDLKFTWHLINGNSKSITYDSDFLFDFTGDVAFSYGFLKSLGTCESERSGTIYGVHSKNILVYNFLEKKITVYCILTW